MTPSGSWHFALARWHCATKRCDAGASVGTCPPLLSIQPFLGMSRTIFPLLFILFPLVLYFLWPSWPDLVDSIIAWGREHPLVWTPLIRIYLGHLESLGRCANNQNGNLRWYFSMKGGAGSRVPHTYSEKWFFWKPFRTIPLSSM